MIMKEVQVAVNHVLHRGKSWNCESGIEEWKHKEVKRTEGGMHEMEDSRKNVCAPASHSGEDAWSQVPGRVDGIAGVEAHRQSNDQDHEAHGEGLQAWRNRVVVWVHNSQDTHDQRRCANDLYKKEL